MASSLRQVVSDYLADYVRDHADALPSGALYKAVVEQAEAALLDTVHRLCRGNRSKMAEMLGINRNTLTRRMLALSLDTVPTAETRRRRSPRRQEAKQ